MDASIYLLSWYLHSLQTRHRPRRLPHPPPLLTRCLYVYPQGLAMSDAFDVIPYEVRSLELPTGAPMYICPPKWIDM